MTTAQSFAQCSINYSYNPTNSNFGLSPDTLPDAVQGQQYNQDLTFVLPLDTTDQGLTVTFTDFHIVSINLPLGLTWQCNNSSNGCHYDPSVDQYGCVNVSGIPLQAGTYSVDVELIATHNLSSIVGTENIAFNLPLVVLPDTSVINNAGFAMLGSSGCAPIQVSFENNNPGMLSYFWDFGNGNTSTLPQPVDQIYTTPGNYVVHYSAVQSDALYFLESIEVVSGGCSDNVLIGDVDLFYDISDSTGIIQQLSPSNAVTQSFPLSINMNNPLQLNGQNLTIDVWDDDGWLWPLEYCGGLTFTPPLQAGTFSSNGGGLSINYTIMEVPANIVTATDTVYVYDYPPIANIDYDSLNNMLSTNSSFFGMQWYYYDSPIPNATDSFVVPNLSGFYSLVGINEFGCTSESDEMMIVICDSAFQPVLQHNGMSVWIADSVLYESVQWYSSGTPILNANLAELLAPTSGVYTVTATDTFGCAYASQEMIVCDPDQEPLMAINGMELWVSDSLNYTSFDWSESGNSLSNYSAFHQAVLPGMYSVLVEDVFGCVYASADIMISASSNDMDESLTSELVVFPNPTTNHLTLRGLQPTNSVVSYEILSIKGFLLENGLLKGRNIDVSNYQAGLYLLRISTQEKQYTLRFMKVNY